MANQPNILLITCDQLRKDSLGCYDNDIVQTPHIDSIAEGGVRFERAFTAYPVCAPNRGSIATSRYPSLHGVHQNGVFLPQDELTLMEVLRQRGYATYGVGKMHFGPQWRYPKDGGPLKDPTPDMAVDPQPEPWEFPWHGFEKAMITEDHRVGPYDDYLKEHGLDIWSDPHSFTYPQHQTVVSAWPEEHHQTTWVGDRTIDYINDHDTNQPMFLWTSFVHPHHPFNPPASYAHMYDPEDMPLPIWDDSEPDGWPEAYRHKHFSTEGGHEAIGMHLLNEGDWQRCKAFYYGMISFIDKQVGRILEALRERDMLDNTLIVFTSDHGEMLGDHHLIFKGTTYDQVTNVPLIVAKPGLNEDGSTRMTLCSSIDIMPTILEMVGIPTPAAAQGRSLAGSLEDTTSPVRAASSGPDAILIENQGVRRSIRTHTALLTYHGQGMRGELYDLAADPDCIYNLWDAPEAAEMQRELLDRLLQMVIQNVDPLPPRVCPC